jgi:hypothetical protein
MSPIGNTRRSLAAAPLDGMTAELGARECAAVLPHAVGRMGK